MLSSYYQEDLFYMGYNVYSAEYKMAIVEEYVARDVTVRDFVKEKNIPTLLFPVGLPNLGRLAIPVLEEIQGQNQWKSLIKLSRSLKKKRNHFLR